MNLDRELEARFDSLWPGDPQRSVRLRGLRRVVRADTVDGVVPALVEVEEAVRSGLHAGGYISYEAAPAMDPSLVAREATGPFPLLWFGLFEDKADGQSFEPDSGDAGETAHQVGELTPTVSPEEYRARAAEILELIAAGDTYQVNYTFRLRGAFTGSAEALYHNLCRAQRSAFCAYLQVGSAAIASASPELFFRRKGDRIEMKPMKGTRPRGRWTGEDDELREELRRSSKDRAENLMIVDLLRNDLGRVCEYGSVKVPSLFDIESYPTVHQMTSRIEGTLRPDISLVEIFQALFPSGSVTGAPKVRTSEIIRGVESSARGPYTGAIGFISGEDSVFSVAIRTALIDHAAGTLELGVGSGITADSSPEAEYEECLSKGAFLYYAPADFEIVESLRLEVPRGYSRLVAHLDRMEATARYFGFRFNRDEVSQAATALAGTCGKGIYKARLLLARDGSVCGTVEAIPAETLAARVTTATARMESGDRFLYHKTTHRTAYQRGLAEHPGFDDVIFFNERGELTESTTGNLVLELDGRLLTPPVHCGLLPGVLRGQLLRDGSIQEQVITANDLNRATRLHIINSVRGWRVAALE